MSRGNLEERIDIQIGKSDYEIIRKVTKRYPYKFYLCKLKDKFCGVNNNLGEEDNSLVFGVSSDLVIICKETIKRDDSSCLIIDLNESNLSINVNVLDGSALTAMGLCFYPYSYVGTYSHERVEELINLFVKDYVEIG